VGLRTVLALGPYINPLQEGIRSIPECTFHKSSAHHTCHVSCMKAICTLHTDIRAALTLFQKRVREGSVERL
jgi:hypothetical protein